MKQHVLKVEEVGKDYSSGGRLLSVLSDISFEIPEASTCSIVGPSGSGKTTLLGLCAGLDRPTRGKVVLGGRELGPLSEEELAVFRSRNLGFVFQSFQLIPTLTALENVMVPAELRGDSGVRGRARQMLSQVGLEDRLDHYPTQLSGGEQQRVALARAFVNRPKVLFADEPTGNLDSATAATVEELIFQLNREYGTTLILVTHNLELASRTNRIISLRGGRILEDRSSALGQASVTT